MTAPAAGLPRGFGIALDRRTQALDDNTLLGGSPLRLLRLSPAGRDALARLRTGVVHDRGDAQLARVLTDRGLAHAVPPSVTECGSVTVIIPVLDRPAQLARCLHALGSEHPVVVVDDGSRDPAAIAAVAANHGARVVRRAANGGPAAARNDGMRHSTGEVVAFLDSDCVPPPDWIRTLSRHFADPAVGAVAPRIRPVPGTGSTQAYAAVQSCLDLGPDSGLVRPGSRIGYVPTAALLVRRDALESLRGGFDVGMRVGEDVDLIWRLHEHGWRVRYDPSVEVAHQEPATWRALLRRRFDYGTSAGPLAVRHPGAVAPVRLAAWPLVAVVGTVAGPSGVAGVGVIGTAVATVRTRRRAGLKGGCTTATVQTLTQTWLATGRYLLQFAAPGLAAATLLRSIPRRRRAMLIALALAGPVSQWLTDRPEMRVAPFVAARVADDVAYGSGVWVGALRSRVAAPILPVVVRGRNRRRATEPSIAMSP